MSVSEHSEHVVVLIGERMKIMRSIYALRPDLSSEQVDLVFRNEIERRMNERSSHEKRQSDDG